MSDLHYQLGRLEQEVRNLKIHVDAIRSEHDRVSAHTLEMLKQIVDVGNGLWDRVHCERCGQYSECSKCEKAKKEWDEVTATIQPLVKADQEERKRN